MRKVKSLYPVIICQLAGLVFPERDSRCKEMQRDVWCRGMQRDAWCKTKEMGGASTDWEIRKGQSANLQILRPLDSTSMFPRTFSWALTVPWTRTNPCSKTCCKFVKAFSHKVDLKLA